MNSPKKSCLLSVMLLSSFVILSHCAPATSLRLHPDFVESPDRAQSVVLLPSESEVTYLELSGDNHRMPFREQEVDSLIKWVVPKILQSQQYETDVCVLPPDSQDAMEFRYSLEQFHVAYGTAIEEMYPGVAVPMKKVTEYPGEIGPLANQLVVNSEADALLFLQYSGFEKSPELMTKQAATGLLVGVLTGFYSIPYREGGQLQAALIDGTTGSILWHNYAVGAFPIEELIEQVFTKFPNYGEPLQSYIDDGIAINHPLRIKDYLSGADGGMQSGPDHVILSDERSYFGRIVDVTESDLMLENRLTLYVIRRKLIREITVSGEPTTIWKVAQTDFPMVNYNGYDERIDIY